MRNFTKTIAAVSLLAPAGVHPLGIGDIKLHSALNQNLNAEIALFVSGNETAGDIQVKLAPPEKFDEAGIPWNYFLSKIEFKPIVKADGSVVVVLTSNEALTEPFLDFLIEVSWPQGNLYREFTVLVDPPATYSQPVIPVATQAVASETTHPPATYAELTPPASIAQADTGTGAISEYGPTGRRDTLWKIANAVKPADASVEQMMMAIYEANPKAFYQPNVNALMAGQTLKIPEREAVLKLSRRQARAEFNKQTKDWRGTVAAAAEAAKKAEEESTPVAETSQLKLLAPVESEVTQTMEVTPGAETVENEAVAETPAETAVAEPETEDAVAEDVEEAPVKVDVENQQLLARLEKLEQQLEQMQKMLLLKDEQLAALQAGKSAAALPAGVQQKSDAGQKTAASTAGAGTPGQTAALASKPVQPAEPVQAKPEPKPETKPEPKPEVQPVVAEATDSGMNPYYMIAAGIGAGLIGLFGWLLWRKRKLEEEQSAESMFAASSQIIMPTTGQELPSTDDSTSYDVGTVGESSFLSEFTPSDFDAFETEQNEVDPISEADVYLAYGRYQQAEELMRQAIADQPDRDECKLKLLEIFYANENKEAFAAYANDLAEAGKKDDAEFWAKVVEMASEIIPDSPLLGGSASDSIATFEETGEAKESKLEVPEVPAASVTAEGELAVAENDGVSIDLTEPADEENAGVSETTGLQMEDFSSMEFDEAAAGELQDAAEALEDNSQDFDLHGLEATPAEDVEGNETVAEAKEDAQSVDFDLSAFDLDAEATADDANEQIDKFEFNLPDDVLGKDDQGENIESMDSFDFASAEEDDQSGLDDFDFKFDIDTPDIALQDEQAGEEELPLGQVSDLTDMDELETKIDMAKAYIDMGDADAAKDIAEEVLEKGNNDQKQEAQEIIDRLH